MQSINDSAINEVFTKFKGYFLNLSTTIINEDRLLGTFSMSCLHIGKSRTFIPNPHSFSDQVYDAPKNFGIQKDRKTSWKIPQYWACACST